MHLIFDTETTGLPLKGQPINATGQPHIMQIGAQLVDENFRVLNEFDYLVQLPDDVIPNPRAVEVTGITKEMCQAKGVTPRQAHCTFTCLLSQAKNVVAHNLAFDLQLWNIFCRRHGFENIIGKKQQHCTMLALTDRMRLPGRYRGKFKWPNLQEAYGFVTGGQVFDGAHDAMADVRAVTTIWKWLQGR